MTKKLGRPATVSEAEKKFRRAAYMRYAQRARKSTQLVENGLIYRRESTI